MSRESSPKRRKIDTSSPESPHPSLSFDSDFDLCRFRQVVVDWFRKHPPTTRTTSHPTTRLTQRISHYRFTAVVPQTSDISSRFSESLTLSDRSCTHKLLSLYRLEQLIELWKSLISEFPDFLSIDLDEFAAYGRTRLVVELTELLHSGSLPQLRRREEMRVLEDLVGEGEDLSAGSVSLSLSLVLSWCLCNVSLPREIMIEILSYLTYDYELIVSLGLARWDFYALILSSWPSVVVQKSNLFSIPRIVMKSVKEVVFPEESSSSGGNFLVKEMQYAVTALAPKKLRSLTFVWREVRLSSMFRQLWQFLKKENVAFVALRELFLLDPEESLSSKSPSAQFYKYNLAEIAPNLETVLWPSSVGWCVDLPRLGALYVDSSAFRGGKDVGRLLTQLSEFCLRGEKVINPRGVLSRLLLPNGRVRILRFWEIAVATWVSLMRFFREFDCSNLETVEFTPSYSCRGEFVRIDEFPPLPSLANLSFEGDVPDMVSRFDLVRGLRRLDTRGFLPTEPQLKFAQACLAMDPIVLTELVVTLDCVDFGFQGRTMNYGNMPYVPLTPSALVLELLIPLFDRMLTLMRFSVVSLLDAVTILDRGTEILYFSQPFVSPIWGYSSNMRPRVDFVCARFLAPALASRKLRRFVLMSYGKECPRLTNACRGCGKFFGKYLNAGGVGTFTPGDTNGAIMKGPNRFGDVIAEFAWMLESHVPAESSG